MSEATKISLICSLGGAAICSVFSLLFYFGDWTRFALVFCFGLFFGLVAAPEFEPKAFKYPTIYQAGGGLASGLVFATIINPVVDVIVLGGLIGAVVGWSAPFWVKHVPIP